jgi:pimeloyl-ACP methyl ester carboxylesterase
MSKIVLIHGAFNELWGPHELKARWLPALRDGLWHHDISVDADDVAVCFYGDMFRLDLATLDLEDWERSRSGAEELLGGFAGADALEFLNEAAGQAAYDRTVAMVATMASDPSLSDRIHRRLLDRIGRETRVLVAHSLGTVIAYRTLVAHPEVDLDMLVTLGSPLGSDRFTDGEDAGSWPGSVRRWVNVIARGDHVADADGLGGRFGDRVEEHLIDNGHRAHHPEPYLNSQVTGGAIAGALRPRSSP